MPLDSLLILIVTHGLPMFLFIYMSLDILFRNHRNLQHVLVALLCLSYFFMFLEELIRNLASIEYSPLLSSFWFSSIGLFSLSICFHYVMLITNLASKLPKWMNPAVFYLPAIPITVNILTGAKLFSTQHFEKVGMWNYPIYDFNYYATMTGSIVTNFIIIIPLLIVYKKASLEKKTVYRSLITMFFLVALFNCVSGYFNFPDFVPPYPYLYSGIIFCFYLKKIMQSTDFLQQYDKRYEKLFSMNPNAIFLIDSNFKLRELNPVGQAFLDLHQINLHELYSFLPTNIMSIIENNKPVRNLEFVLQFNNYEYDLLLNIDHINIDLQPHYMIIFQNITALKEQQREIEFLAYHDPMTKLPNRRYFYEKIETILKDASHDGDIITIYLLDINNLKMLNDFKGHEAGDQAIQMLANVLKDVVHGFGIVARLGGDEFIVCLNETKSMYTPEQFIQLVKTEYAKQLTIFDNIPVGTSIGYSRYPTDSKNINTLVTLADQAMYEMKKLKKVHYR